MTESQQFWQLVYLAKIFRSDLTNEAKRIADKAVKDFEAMRREGDE